MTLRYRMQSELPPVASLRLKVEINTREHFVALGVVERALSIRSPWFTGRAGVRAYVLEELLATKLRALYQRRKGRDLFDLWIALDRGDPDPARIVLAFRAYMRADGRDVRRGAFAKNLALKAASPQFDEDLRPLLAPGIRYDAAEAARLVTEQLLALL